MSTDVLPSVNGSAKTSEVAVVKPREIRIVEDDGPAAFLMDTARFEHMQRIATVMAQCALIPDHLRGKVRKSDVEWYTKDQVFGNCFLIVNQAMRWRMDPFAVAAETYVVAGKLGFQGKLVAAVVNARAGLQRDLWYTFNEAKGDALTVTVHGLLIGETEPKTVDLSVGQGKTENAMWRTDPHQKLVYSGVTKWARRHKPGVILGVVTDDDLERIRESSTESERAPKRLSDLVAAVSQSPEPQTEAIQQPELSRLDFCAESMQEIGLEVVRRDGFIFAKLPNGQIVKVTDGDPGAVDEATQAVNANDDDALIQISNIVERSRKSR
jgi:hypothetical protein